jgi:hypothetical protein
MTLSDPSPVALPYLRGREVYEESQSS